VQLLLAPLAGIDRLVIFGTAIDGRNMMKPLAGFAIGLTITMDIPAAHRSAAVMNLPVIFMRRVSTPSA